MNAKNAKDAIIKKAEYYSKKNLKCHIKIFPTGFRNGTIISDLVDNTFFWFIDIRNPEIEERIFLHEILDIVDYIDEAELK
jgi:hypothetical protein